jgi:histone deacetylase complex regulatory component SIN3
MHLSLLRAICDLRGSYGFRDVGTVAGYKIELTPEEQAFNHPGQEVPPQGPHMASSSSNLHPGGAAGALPASGVVGSGPGAAAGHMGGSAGYPGMAGNGAPGGYYGPGGMPGQPMMPGMPPQTPQAGMGPGGAGAGGNMPPGAAPQGGPPGGPQAQQPGQMQQAHAIHYVTKIRNRFSTEPDTYR